MVRIDPENIVKPIHWVPWAPESTVQVFRTKVEAIQRLICPSW